MRSSPTLRLRLATLGAALALAVPAAAPAAQAAGSVLPHRVTVSPTYSLAQLRPGTTTFNCQKPTATVFCYGPSQIQNAYGISSLLGAGVTGQGRTIVIIDAFGNPYIQTDLQIFDQTFGLPDPIFNVIAPQGAPAFDLTNADMVGWSGEISLDVQWAHAVAPEAKIDLVVARSDQDADILAATKWAVDHNLGDVISQSFGEAESCVDPAILRAEHQVFLEATRKGMTIFASSGDDGAAQPTCDFSSLILSASSPASDPLVTGVGGTNLFADLSSGAYQNEVAWNDGFGESGGGFSTIYKRPAYQAAIGGTSRHSRGVPDIAYNAGVVGGVLTHWGVGNIVLAGLPADDANAFWIFGGTSAGSPQWSGLISLADQMAGHRIGQINPELYAITRFKGAYAAAYHDITSGDNVVGGVGGYQAATGWDPVTGLGTPKANVIVPLLAHLP